MDVRRDLAEERERMMIDLITLRELEDWSFLNDKVVGAEGN